MPALGRYMSHVPICRVSWRCIYGEEEVIYAEGCKLAVKGK